MLTKEEFIDEVMNGLKEFYADEAEIELQEVTKVNGLVLQALCIKLNDESGKAEENNVLPLFYLDQYYERYERQYISLDEAVGEIIDIRSAENTGIAEVAKNLMNFEYVKNKIYPMVLPTEDNRELLEKYVHSSFIDLSVIYYVRIDREDSEVGTASVKITEDLLSHYGIGLQELHELALFNMENDGYSMRPIFDVIKELLPAVEDEVRESNPDTEMYVLTNKSAMNGAAILLQETMLSDILGENDYFILPSSIHELILVPFSEGIDVISLKNIVNEVNCTSVRKEDKLSNQVYLWKQGNIEIAA